jgi:hypothetical protein
LFEYILRTASAATPSHPHASSTAAEKPAIVLETEQPSTTVSQVARAHRIVVSVLFRWRAELGFGKSKTANLVAVRMAGSGNSDVRAEVAVLQDILPIPPGAVVVDRRPSIDSTVVLPPCHLPNMRTDARLRDMPSSQSWRGPLR